MTHRLPPLNALRAFEAAARHLSFNKAALELHVTQAAISHQIKALEHYLEVQLFRRLNRSLQLTEEAQVCLPKLREGFDCLAEAVEDVRAQNKRGRLTVSVAPSFAAKWLVPRLHRFAAAHPDIDMWISASMELIDKQNPHNMKPLDFRKGNVDVAIRFGWGKYPGFRADKLLEVSMIPMCSPRLLEGKHPLRKPEDLRHHTLLHDDTLDYDELWPGWSMWLNYAGVTGVDASHGQHFSHAVLALEAAIEEQGVVLSLRNLAAADLMAGRLVTPFPLSISLNFAYYVVCPTATADRPKIAVFREWLLEEAHQDERTT